MYDDLGKARLVINGPYEFLPDDPFLYGQYAPEENKGQRPPKDEAHIALRAYNLLQSDIGWMSPQSAAWLRQACGALPANFHEIRDIPLLRIVKTTVGTVGIVLFPQGPIAGKEPTAAQMDMALKAGMAVKHQADLLIGVSPWGLVAEKTFLAQASGVYDILLGGGEGVAFAYSADDAPNVLWVRPDSQGRAVNVVDILRMPKAKGRPHWKENRDFRAVLEFLDASYPELPAMNKILDQ